MQILSIVFIIAAYFFLVFMVLRLVAPFYGFGQYGPPESIPNEIRQAITELENKSQDQMSYLQAVYGLILNKTLHQWHHTRFKAGTKIHRVFVKDLSEIWQTKKFLYCMQINYAAYCLLTQSKFFTAQDVRTQQVFANLVSHQYLEVKVGDAWIDFDPTGVGIRGRGLGEHLSFFG
jgi:hypothetical protein